MLPQKLPLSLMQTQWAQQLDPVLSSPTTNPTILKNISLVSGSNTVNHLLGRPLQGWSTSRIRASATLYDTQDSNQTPNLTLVLVASAPVVIDLVVW